MNNEWGQLADFARLFVRLRPNLRWIALVSTVLALIVGAYVALTYEPSFVSETIAIVRPQQILVGTAKEGAEQRVEPNKNLLPQPLDVTDYVLFLQSEGMLSLVAQAYNTYHVQGSENLLTVAQLRRMLSPMSRLEIKTPYTVEYYPTIEMRVSAQDADKAYNLATLWVEAARDWAKTVTFSAKEETARYLKNETGEQRASLEQLAGKLNSTTDEGNQLLESLKAERLAVEQGYETETIKILQDTADAWDTRIAAAEAEFALPLAEANIDAKKSILGGLELAKARKSRELEQARATLAELAAQLEAPEALTGIEGVDRISWEIGVSEGKEEIEPVRVAPSETDALREQEMKERASQTLAAEKERREKLTELVKSYTEFSHRTLREKEERKIEDVVQSYTKLPHRAVQEKQEEKLQDALETPQSPSLTPGGSPEETQLRTPPTLSPEVRRRIEAFRVESSGGNPVAVLLQKELSEARIVLASAPLELTRVEQDIATLQKDLESLQADYLARRKALLMLDRAKEADLNKVNRERMYGLMREQRVTEMKVDQLSRERKTMEEALGRDFKTAEDIFKSLAESHLQAELALANTIDEFQIVSPPTYPEEPPGAQFLLYAAVAFVFSFCVLFVLAAFVLVLRSIVRSIQAAEAPNAT
ncbi:MAG TPA: hypothetical protein PLM14_09000 [Candidatus Hydrogenedentes bacterium]|nr:hypothetical protein [Candidatus Hydrogenedentota bacterium]HQE83126.1 hypothetical protein [Candidatus Hydrogenedentota bacterium]HQH50834.1 hypothetical protein [Candidatus Hydrogenedentota bacterium]HQM50119.1 hypothetical protein [Candidatus Hydrogenedentota bacterium]